MFAAEACLSAIFYAEFSNDSVDKLRRKLGDEQEVGQAELISLDLQKATSTAESDRSKLAKSLDALSNVDNGDEWLAIFESYMAALEKARVGGDWEMWNWLHGLKLEQVVDR